MKKINIILISITFLLTFFISPTFSQTREEMEEFFRERQIESYQWLLENNHITGEPNWEDNDYYKMKLRQEKEYNIMRNNLSLIFEVLGYLAFLSFLQFLIYLKDMIKRNEKIFFWGIIFLVSGPIGLTFYLSYRKLKKEETREGKRLYHLSKNFILPWVTYILGGSILIVLITICIFFLVSAGVDINSGGIDTFDHLLELFFWIGLILAVFVIPVKIIIPVVFALIIMFLTKGNKKEKEETKKEIPNREEPSS
jgi:hypothetical protein